MFGVGDTWTWVAIDADSKLVISWLLGERTAECANYFMADVAKRLVNRIQLTTDGFQPYRWAVGMAFHGEIDYAMLVKTYGREEHGAGRYSPPICTGAMPKVIRGNPDPAHISTSFSERQNLSMRMHLRRFTRLTNAFSKKVENLEAAIALYFYWYNFIRVHRSIRATPAMRAGIASRVHSFGDVLRLIG